MRVFSNCTFIDNSTSGVRQAKYNLFGYKQINSKYTYINEVGKKVTVKKAALEETATTGLAGKKNYKYTENMLRIENGLPIRVKY